MKTIGVLCCFVAVTLAGPAKDVIVEYLSNGNTRCTSAGCRGMNQFGNCPPVDCPHPDPAPCSSPNYMPNCCNSLNWDLLHNHWDANLYWQCIPDDDVLCGFRAIERKCGCGTLFNFRQDPRRCIHAHDFDGTYSHCPQHSVPRVCEEECPSCPVGTPPTPGPITPGPVTPGPITPGPITPGPVTPGPVTPGPDNGCPCICIPCVWWPCMPCPTSGCPCNNRQQQPPHNPWQLPQQPQQPQQPELPPWQRPPQNPWQQPPQNQWQQPNW